MATTTLFDTRLRVAHLIVPLQAGGTLTALARTALEFASRSANRVTLVYITEASLESLDSGMRRLALVVGTGCAGEAVVKMVVRYGSTVDAVSHVLAQDHGYVWAGDNAELQQRFDCIES